MGEPARTGPTVMQQIEEDENSPLMDVSLLDIDEARAVAGNFLSLVDLWDSKRNGRVIPRWCDFDFTDFIGHHQDIVLSRFPENEPDPEFFLSGETFNQIVDSNVRGLRFSECWPRLFKAQFRTHFGSIQRTAKIGYTQGQVATINRSFITVNVLELPVSGAESEEVTQLIHAVRECRPA